MTRFRPKPCRRCSTPFTPSGGGTLYCGECRAIRASERGERLVPMSRGKGHATHGMSWHPLYRAWAGMMDRCGNPASTIYPDYGGRGIRVCERWHDPAVFFADIERWLGPRPEGRYPNGRPMWTLDRIMNDHDYRLDNVRWATASQQMLNRRRSARFHLRPGHVISTE